MEAKRGRRDWVATARVVGFDAHQDAAGVELERVVAQGIDGIADDGIERGARSDAVFEGGESLDFRGEVAGGRLRIFWRGRGQIARIQAEQLGE